MSSIHIVLQFEQEIWLKLSDSLRLALVTVLNVKFVPGIVNIDAGKLKYLCCVQDFEFLKSELTLIFIPDLSMYLKESTCDVPSLLPE